VNDQSVPAWDRRVMAAAKKQSRVRTNQNDKPKIMAFKTAGQLENWLAKNHDSSAGVWL